MLNAVKDVTIHERRVSVKVSLQELEDFIINTMKQQSGVQVDENTQIRFEWGDDFDDGVSVCIVNDLSSNG